MQRLRHHAKRNFDDFHEQAHHLLLPSLGYLLSPLSVASSVAKNRKHQRNSELQELEAKYSIIVYGEQCDQYVAWIRNVQINPSAELDKWICLCAGNIASLNPWATWFAFESAPSGTLSAGFLTHLTPRVPQGFWPDTLERHKLPMMGCGLRSVPGWAQQPVDTAKTVRE